MAFESSSGDRQQAKRSVYTAETDARWTALIANKKGMGSSSQIFSPGICCWNQEVFFDNKRVLAPLCKKKLIYFLAEDLLMLT
ncbi:hypothetical protein KIN20_029563 [Parelaphostrongylus tenuis]|uniref:Uncharacterized protein n=1 Tax=Parelaphostrongylus tenuis TaxID=148309 RepID=A0AAD5WG70_PARTN|nr:hypothetical protein KIN20_029563 [Parelaphostrongylus tenuis]